MSDMMLTRVARQGEHPRHADDREREREHDRERVDERLELRREDQVDEDDREDERLGHVAEGLLHALGVAREVRPGSPAPSSIFAAASWIFSAAVPSGRPSRFAVRMTSRERSCRVISEGVVARSALTRSESGTSAGAPPSARDGDPQVADLADVAAQLEREADPDVDRLALLVLVGRDGLAADERADGPGDGRRS